MKGFLKMNDKVKELAERLSRECDDLKHLAEALSRGEEWASFSSSAKHHGTRWAIGYGISLIQRLCDSIDKEWTE